MDEKLVRDGSSAKDLYIENGSKRGGIAATSGHNRSLLRSLLMLLAGVWLVYTGTWRLFNILPEDSHQAPIPPEPGSRLLEVIQVYKPPPYEDEDACTQTLMEHVFAFSYGDPFVGDYNPPACEWTHVTFNLSFVSRGVQFDRLALLYLDDVEIWRTSTAEPTYRGIHWEYIKDMTAYRSLLKTSGRLVMDLGNLVNEVYTGTFNGTLTATYYNTPKRNGDDRIPSQGIVGVGGNPAANPPHVIYPISAMRSKDGLGSEFRIPRDNASASIALGGGSFSRATISISASGDSLEEFWYTNVPSSLAETFDGDPLPKYSAFREVQVWLDGEMVGVAWPFPVIFTGGVSPGLWRPIVGMSAFDLVEYEVDVTPWLWKICDGQEHLWELRVVGLEEEGRIIEIGSTVAWDWIVTGRLMLWESPPDSGRTKGSLISHTPDWDPAISLSYSWTSVDEKNDTLSVKLSVMRTVSTISTLEFDGYSTTASFSQALRFSSETFISAGGANQTAIQTTDITMASSTTGMQASYHFPLKVANDFVFYENGALSIIAAVDRGLYAAADRYEEVQKPIKRSPDGFQQVVAAAAAAAIAASQPKFLLLSNRQNGTSTYFSRGGPGTTTGHTEQVYSWQESGFEKYFRHVEAEGFHIIRDEEQWILKDDKQADKVTRLVHTFTPNPESRFLTGHEDVCLGRFEHSKLSRLPQSIKKSKN